MSGHKLPGEFVYRGCHFDNLVTSPKMLEGIGQLTLTPQDVIVTAYAKSGTHWLKYMTTLIMNEGESAQKLTNSRYERHLEFCLQPAGENEDDVLRTIQQTAPPRLFSSHVPLRFIEKQVMEDNAKVIVVMRNPKDMLVSLFHFYKMNAALGSFGGTWDEFFELFKGKRLWGGDVFDFNIGWWKLRERDNIFITTYEDTKKDSAGTVRQIAQHVGKTLSDEAVDKIVEQTSFTQMQGNPKVNRQDLADMGLFDFSKSKFIRKGEVGGWKKYFSAEQEKYIDDLYAERCDPIGLQFQDTL